MDATGTGDVGELPAPDEPPGLLAVGRRPLGKHARLLLRRTGVGDRVEKWFEVFQAGGMFAVVGHDHNALS
jgi:hypothetical protein